MHEEKYLSFPQEDREKMETLELQGYSNRVIEIRDPNNPAKLISARFLSYEI